MSDKVSNVPRELLARLQERLDPHLDARDWGMICDLLASAAQSAPAGAVPAGWRMERSGDRIIVQQLPAGAGYAAAREGESGIAESVLYLLADTLLAAPQQPAQVDERPISTCQRGLFETWAMETKHPVFSFIGEDWLDHGDDPNTYANDYIQGAWVMWQHLHPAAQQGTTSDRYRAELYDEVWQKARDMGFGNVTMALAEVERLKALINTPHTGEWFEAVRLEAAHQIERWGTSHDAGKTPADWFWLLGYLGQKAMTAQIAGDDEKARHHTISSGAMLLNWYRAMVGDSDAMRPGIEVKP